MDEFGKRTLSADQDERDLRGVAELGHFGVVAVDGVETGFALQAEDEDDRIHPGGELQIIQRKEKKIELNESPKQHTAYPVLEGNKKALTTI